jgi:hypothetical protein
MSSLELQSRNTTLAKSDNAPIHCSDEPPSPRRPARLPALRRRIVGLAAAAALLGGGAATMVAAHPAGAQTLSSYPAFECYTNQINEATANNGSNIEIFPIQVPNGGPVTQWEANLYRLVNTANGPAWQQAWSSGWFTDTPDTLDGAMGTFGGLGNSTWGATSPIAVNGILNTWWAVNFVVWQNGVGHAYSAAADQDNNGIQTYTGTYYCHT